MGNDPDSVVTLTSAPNEMVAGLIVAALEREGIKASMAGTSTAEFRVGAPEDVEVYVRAADLERAEQVLKEAHYEFGEDDEEEGDEE